MTGNKLVIVESPTKARKIGGYLGDGYTVMASVGHIRDLAQPSQIPAEDKARYGKFGVDVDDGFLPYYVVGKDKKKTVSDLKKALKTADELYLATDEDREGEAIAWHLVQTLKPKVPVKRMVFHEITKNAIAASLGKTRQVDDNMVDAQETRRVLDRLYGYELSPVLWRKVGPGLSAGRVQSVATRLIVQRERERMAFVRTAYWDIVATVAWGGGVGVNAQGQKVTGDEAVDTSFKSRLISVGGRRVATSKDFDAQGQPTRTMVKDQALALNQADADRICQAIAGQDFTVMSLETKPYRRRPVPPFTTSTMQQAAGNRLGMSSRAAMRAAQGLYENGYITYMRTDSVTLSSEAIAAAREEVEKKWGGSYLSEKPKQYATTSAGAQEAHECIRPAGAHFRSPESMEGKVPPDQLKLYRLIWQRTLASQMADATGSTATVKLSAAAGLDGEVVFQSSGTVIDFLGFLRAYGEGRGTGSSPKPPWSRPWKPRKSAGLPPMPASSPPSSTAVMSTNAAGPSSPPGWPSPSSNCWSRISLSMWITPSPPVWRTAWTRSPKARSLASSGCPTSTSARAKRPPATLRRPMKACMTKWLSWVRSTPG